MPEGVYNLLDLARLEAGIGFNLIEENLAISPELQLIGADTIEGDVMTLTVRTDLPEVGFRDANSGTPRSKSGYITKTFQTLILDHQCAVDKALADKRKPAARGRMLENHASGVLEASIRLISKQFYYGVKHDGKGFPGIISQYSNDADHRVNVGASANKSSVWFLRVGRETLEFLFGNDRTITFQKNWGIETVYDSDQNPYQAYTNWMNGNVGLRLANRHAAVRISNIGTGANETLTWDHMHSAYRKFTDLGWEPNVILMNGRSREQLRQELITPENKNPTAPKEFENIPITHTSHISSVETI